jgi:4'-phosphopantetheinyl transferase
MPVVKYEQVSQEIVWALWEITESKEELLKKIFLSPFERKEVQSITNERKLLETLAGKALIKSITESIDENYCGLKKDEFSKPFLENSSFHISLSHSFPFAGAIINKIKPVGIDIEKPTEKIVRIKNKFLSEAELREVKEDAAKACTYWAAKEALYKLHGRKRLIFKEDLAVNILKTSPNLELSGEIIIGSSKKSIKLFAACHQDLIIVFTTNDFS